MVVEDIETKAVPRRPGRPPVVAKRDIQVYVVLNEEEDRALRALAAREGLAVADCLRVIIRREARRYGHLPPGTGPFLSSPAEESAVTDFRGNDPRAGRGGGVGGRPGAGGGKGPSAGRKGGGPGAGEGAESDSPDDGEDA